MSMGIHYERNKKEAEQVWLDFEKLCAHKKKRAQREALLEHTFKFSGDGLDHDYGNLVAELDGQRTKIAAAERGASFFEFYSLVERIRDGGCLLFNWDRLDGKPIRPRLLWFFSRRGDILYVKIPDFPEGVLIRREDFLAQITAKGVPVQESQEEKMARHWRRFGKLSPEKREKRLTHSFSWDPKKGGACGWQDLSVSLDGDCALYHVSIIGCDSEDAGRDLIHCVKALPPHADRYFSWSREPGSYDWYFSRREDFLYMEIPDLSDGVVMRYADVLRALTKGYEVT